MGQGIVAVMLAVVAIVCIALVMQPMVEQARADRMWMRVQLAAERTAQMQSFMMGLVVVVGLAVGGTVLGLWLTTRQPYQSQTPLLENKTVNIYLPPGQTRTEAFTALFGTGQVTQDDTIKFIEAGSVHTPSERG